MNIVFLDDSKERWEAVKPFLHKAKWVKTVDKCVPILSEPDKEWNIVFLDHDLMDYKDGMDIAKWIVENNPIIRNIVCHSDNPSGAANMASVLKQAQYNVSILPFSALLNNLKAAAK